MRQHLGRLREAQASERTVCLQVTAGPHGGCLGSSWVGSAAHTTEEVGTGRHTTGRYRTTTERCDATCYCAVSDPEKKRQAMRGFSGFQPLLFLFPFAPSFLACCTGSLFTGQSERWEQGHWAFSSKCH